MPVLCLAFSRDGRQALSGGGAVEGAEGEETPLDCSVRLWDVASGTLLCRFDGHTGPVCGVAFHPDGRHVCSGGLDGTIRLWDRDTGRESGRVADRVAPVQCLALAPDGRCLLSGDAEGLLRVWDVEPGQQPRTVGRLDAPVQCLAFSPDGRKVLAAAGRLPGSKGGDRPAGGAAGLWDVAGGKELRRWQGPATLVRSVAFSPDGHRVLAGGLDSTLYMWDLDSRNDPRRFAGHRSAIHSVAFSPDGRYALSGGADGTVRQWYLKR
jgi:WD40 repeat protein